MSMPLGKKVESGYAVNKDWADYRTIAKLLSDNGVNMNHNSARNWVLRALTIYATALAKKHNSKIAPEDIAKNPMFQEAIYIHLAENISNS